MKFFHSIRWRLQLWHGLVLALVLAGFGFTAWQLQRTTQWQRVDQELERRIQVISSAMRRSGPTSGRPPQERLRPPNRGEFGDPPPDRGGRGERGEFGDLPPPRMEWRLTGRDSSLFEATPAPPYYYVAWQRDGWENARSATAPARVPHPDRNTMLRGVRMRGTLREVFHFTPPGDCILVGRDLRDDLADARRTAWLLAAAGGLVLLIGLACGWWISTRALRPISDISATATQIARGDLAQRVHTPDTDSELGDLVRVLNDTFARLQASFARQVQFTADASHELRTPVTVVLTQTQAALARERPGAEYRETLQACQRAAQRMRRLIESLLTLARLDAGEAATTREPVDLDAVAGEAVELLRPLAQLRGVSLVLELTPVRCDGNAEQLAQVVTNLVTNAIDYNRPDGEVRIQVTAAPGVAVLAVSDLGQGIAADNLPHLFERFYRADKARTHASGHTGLGLAITQAIVEAHAGTIQVVSQPDQGSTFTVRLPLPPLS